MNATRILEANNKDEYTISETGIEHAMSFFKADYNDNLGCLDEIEYIALEPTRFNLERDEALSCFKTHHHFNVIRYVMHGMNICDQIAFKSLRHFTVKCFSMIDSMDHKGVLWHDPCWLW